MISFHFISFFYTTVPGKPEVSVEQPKSVVMVSWTLEQNNGIIKDYHVTYIREDDPSDSKTLTAQKMEQRFEELMAGKTYQFQVDCGLISQAFGVRN